MARFGSGWREKKQQSDLERNVHLRALRIPDHLRKMGMARRALHAICKLAGGKPFVEPLHAPEDVADVAALEQTGEHLKLAAELRHGRAALRGILDSIDA